MTCGVPCARGPIIRGRDELRLRPSPFPSPRSETKPSPGETLEPILCSLSPSPPIRRLLFRSRAGPIHPPHSAIYLHIQVAPSGCSKASPRGDAAVGGRTRSFGHAAAAARRARTGARGTRRLPGGCSKASAQPPPQYAQPPPPQQPQPQPMWGQPPPPQAAPYGQAPAPQQYYAAPQVAPAAPASADEVRTLWIGDLQYWMDENYIYGCFASTGEVRVPIRREIPASRSIDLM